MQKVNCQEGNHLWVCKEESGFLNEITTYRSLNSTEITGIKSDNTEEYTICPKGAIVCASCNKYLNENKIPKSYASKIQTLKTVSAMSHPDTK